jgi:tetratricopeptide (TPR) repeat protein
LLDITPTSLALLGLPVGHDMDGRVLIEAFDRPITIDTLFSWDMLEGDAGLHPADRRQDPFEAHAAIKQLVDLGYMADLPADAKSQVELVERESQFNLGVVYMTTRHPEQAAKVFEKLVERVPNDSRYVTALARSLFLSYQFEAAANSLRTFLAKHSGNVEASLFLAGVLATMNRDAEAAKYLARLEAEHADKPELAVAFGDVCASLRKWDDADRYYQCVIAHDPTNAHAFSGLARAALGREQFDHAVDYCLRAVELQHMFPEAHHMLGVALTWMKEYNHAIQSFQIALSMAPGLLDSHRYLASIYRHLGDREGAARHRIQAEKLIAAKASGEIHLEFLKRAAPLGPQEWARSVGLSPESQ